LNNLKLPKWKNFHTIIFDFDGVFTDNKVWINEKGEETIKCDRADGLGFDILRKFITKNNWDLEYYILSTETNLVVKKRAIKLKVTCYQGINNKLKFIEDKLHSKRKINSDFYKGLIYLGNDLNDLQLSKKAGLSIAPNDAHYLLKKEANLVLDKSGGSSFVREFIELLIGIKDMSENDIYELLY